ncbi:hypothetical protein PR003_g9184 [Phytophthora rubi]|uniref:PiggyBac transposable element-derived protein domain-containing protein n=1 Tax=Phytophthora rubi TaxID=129364 RepID=A0A6A4F971_9STRA|nr:hypothetical protein PR003_g9184 [Phytophthora rubi]
MRSSRREKPAAPAAAPHDIDFGHLWRQFRAAGWTPKRPTGIQVEWAYKSPEGENVLLGERAVVEYAFMSGLMVEDEEPVGDEGGGGEHVEEEGGGGEHYEEHVGEEDGGGEQIEDEGGGGENVEEEGGGGEHGEEHVREEDGGGEHVGVEGGGGDDAAIRPSQIDTSVLRSQNTIEQMFGPSESETELSQAAVARAFDLSQRDLQADDEQRDAAASLRLLSDASELESEGEDERAVTSPIAPPRRTRIPLKLDADVNVLQDGESSSEYKDFRSDDSDSAGICDDDGDSGSDEFDEERGDEISDSDAAEMDEAFLASLHIGGNGELNKAALKQRAAALQAMKWTPAMAEFDTDTPAYPGLDADEARPVGELLDVWRSPLLTLFCFVPKTVWVSIAKETNRYFLQQVGKRAERMAARRTGHQRETAAQIARRLKAFEEYGAHEILRVVGLLVARMLCPQKMSFAAHWSMVEDGAIPAGLFGRYMSRDRCQNILRDLHFVNNTADHGRDKLWKLRPVVDKIQERFLAGWLLPAIFSFDEGVLPATSKRNTTRMFMPDKPHRYGSKLFMLCDTKTAYCHSCPAEPVTPQSRHNWHAVIIDRYYTSVLLAVELLKLKVYVVGTIMTNRLGLDKSIKSEHKSRPASIPRGSFVLTRSVSIPAMISCLWWDRKPVYYLCTGSAMTPSTLERKV